MIELHENNTILISNRSFVPNELWKLEASKITRSIFKNAYFFDESVNFRTKILDMYEDETLTMLETVLNYKLDVIIC